MRPSHRKGTAWLLWFGHFASILCLIHCLATVALTFVAPSILKLMPHNLYVELGAWTFVLISTLFILSRAPKRLWHHRIFGGLFLAGTLSLLVFHNHNLFALCFVLLAVFQLYLTIRHHLQEHTLDDECCQHPEHKHHPLHAESYGDPVE